MIRAHAITPRLVSRWIPARPRDAHKGSSGRVLVVAGSKGMMGAALLTATAAARAGAGLVRLALPASQYVIAALRLPLEVTTAPLPENHDGCFSTSALPSLARLLQGFRPDVIAVGPGLGQSSAIRRLVRFLLQAKIPLVLDADGLNALAEMTPVSVAPPLVLTPHVGELGRLLGRTPSKILRDREGSALRAAKRFRAVCLLKGPGTLVTDGRDLWRNTTGNPGMASGGMGDALTGVIAALWSGMKQQNIPSGLIAAAAGAFLHGAAADRAVRKRPERTLLASDVIEAFPEAFFALRRRS